MWRSITASMIFFLLCSRPLLAAEYHFCLLSDRGNANVTSKEADNVKFAQAADNAEQRYCNLLFALVCAAVSYDDVTCGSSEKMEMDFTRAQSQIYHENPDGSTAVRADAAADLRVLFTPDAIKAESTIRDSIALANGHLKNAQCPAHFAQHSPSETLPESFMNFHVSDLATLRTIAHYPGTIKVVSDISFCDDAGAIKTLDQKGQEQILECPSRTYSTFVVTPRGPQITAILLLMGYGRLAGLKQDVGGSKEYSLSDFDLLIPDSKLLNGDFSAFHITRDQCVTFATYALRQRELQGP